MKTVFKKFNTVKINIVKSLFFEQLVYNLYNTIRQGQEIKEKLLANLCHIDVKTLNRVLAD